MNKTIAIILDHIYASQIAYESINALNKIVDKNNDVAIFTKNISPSYIPAKFGIFGLHSIHNISDGTIIATDLDSAEVLINSQTTANKIFYVWDLEWLHNQQKKSFLQNVNIYKNIEIVTRSKSYSDAINNYCNIRPKVLSIEELVNVI
jgi:hypothetical protein